MTFNSPTAGATVSGSIVWSVQPTVAFDHVDFIIDGGPVGWTETSCPCHYNGDPNGRLDTTTLSNGTHTLTAKAYNSSGTEVAESSESMTVSNAAPPPPPTTTAPTTTTPTPTGTSCFASPGSCGYPDPAYGNVGVPAGTNLTPSGSITVSTAGTVINGLNITGTVTVKANNVTIQNSKITCNCGTGNVAVSASGVSGLTIKNSEISGGNVFDGRATLSGVYMHNCDNCDLYGTSISDSYLIDDQTNSGSHYEPYYGSGDVIDIEHSVLLNPHSQTAAVFMNGGGSACSNHLTVNNNLLGGGGYTIYPCANSSSAGSSVIKITNNRFARCTTTPFVNTNDGTLCSGIGSTNGDVVTKPDGFGYFPNGGKYGYDSYIFCGQTTWSNNLWDDNGATVGC